MYLESLNLTPELILDHVYISSVKAIALVRVVKNLIWGYLVVFFLVNLIAINKTDKSINHIYGNNTRIVHIYSVIDYDPVLVCFCDFDSYF